METVREFTYLGDSVGEGGEYEAAVTARTGCVWVKFRECGELLYGRRFPLGLKGSVYESYYSQQYCMEMSHGACKKVIWEFYEGHKDPW